MKATTIAALFDTYAVYGATRGFIRAQATSIATQSGTHIGDDQDPLPNDVAEELIADLDEHAEDFERQAPERQAAYDELVRGDSQTISTSSSLLDGWPQGSTADASDPRPTGRGK